MANEVYSICFMCTVRCPIRVLVENDDVKWIEGNPHVPGIEGALCAKGSAGLALLHDDERPQYPMIRTGPRGAGEWKKATWNEALDYVADKLKEIIKQHGAQSVVFGERTNLNTHISKTFMKAIGSPNHFTHDALCKGSLNTAFRSLTGFTDAQVGVDYANTKYIVMYGRNIFEALEIKAINNLLNAMEKGAKLIYIDPRVSITATKADRYLMIRPGTDLAFNYALIHTILKERLLRRPVRPPLGQGPEGTPGLCGALHPGMGRGGNRHPGPRDRHPGPGSRGGQTRGGLPLRLPERAPSQ